jgi:hypothetical protein
MTRASFACRPPESFKSVIFEYPDGRFEFRAEYIDRHAAKPQRPALYDFDHRVAGSRQVDLGGGETLCGGLLLQGERRALPRAVSSLHVRAYAML